VGVALTLESLRSYSAARSPAFISSPSISATSFACSSASALASAAALAGASKSGSPGELECFFFFFPDPLLLNRGGDIPPS
jgi:hypothetical protein